MVGLVIKKVVECRGKFLFDIGRSHKGTKANKASKVGFTQSRSGKYLNRMNRM
jgi:hypothetical protein